MENSLLSVIAKILINHVVAIKELRKCTDLLAEELGSWKKLVFSLGAGEKSMLFTTRNVSSGAAESMYENWVCKKQINILNPSIHWGARSVWCL